MKILFADSVQERRLAALRSQGHELVVDPSLTAENLGDHLGGVEVLVVRSTKVTPTTIKAADQLGLIVRAGAGTDNIDTAVASQGGVYVCNVPGRNAVAVAELTMGLLLAIDRRIADNVADLRERRWNKARYSAAEGLLGKTIAIIGLGEIGLAVAERAKAFGLTITAQRRDGRSEPTLSRIRSIGIRLVETRSELLAGADIVSLHVPKSSDTARLVDADFLAALAPGAVLLNTSRGEVVDEPALLAALDRDELMAGLDVWADEPSGAEATFDSALARHPRVVGTHHIGAATEQAQDSVAEGTIEVIEAYLQGEILNCVNLGSGSVGTSCLTVRHLDRVGVLAKVFAELRSQGLNVQQMQNQIFAGGEAAVATINVAAEPSQETIDALCRIDEVLGAAVVPATEGSRS